MATSPKKKTTNYIKVTYTALIRVDKARSGVPMYLTQARKAMLAGLKSVTPMKQWGKAFLLYPVRYTVGLYFPKMKLKPQWMKPTVAEMRAINVRRTELGKKKQKGRDVLRSEGLR